MHQIFGIRTDFGGYVRLFGLATINYYKTTESLIPDFRYIGADTIKALKLEVLWLGQTVKDNIEGPSANVLDKVSILDKDYSLKTLSSRGPFL